VRPPWDMISIPLFWQSNIFWDTVAYLVGTPCPADTPPRRVKRSVARHKRRKKCNMPSLFFGGMTWMVLGGSILIPTATFQGPAHPFSTVTRQLEGAYTRIQRLDEAVDLSPSTFMQYQSLEAKKLWKEIKSKQKRKRTKLTDMVARSKLTRASFSMRTKTYRYTARSFLTDSKSLNLKIMILGQDAIFWILTVLIAIAS
jgi:hypothetical protein